MDLSNLGKVNGNPFNKKRKEQLEKEWAATATRLKNSIEATLKEEGATLVPKLMINDGGINPFVIILPTPEHKDFQEMAKLQCRLDLNPHEAPPEEEQA